MDRAHRAWRAGRLVLAIGAALIVAVPFAALITIITWPFWSWFEATTGIESMGHSGPADWCFILVYALVSGALVGGIVAVRRRREAGRIRAASTAR